MITLVVAAIAVGALPCALQSTEGESFDSPGCNPCFATC